MNTTFQEMVIFLSFFRLENGGGGGVPTDLGLLGV